MGKRRIVITAALFLLISSVFIGITSCHVPTVTVSVDLVQQYLDEGKYDQVITECNKALQTNPEDAKAFCRRGIAFFYKGNYYQAVSDLNKAIEFNPELSEAFYYRAIASGNYGSFDAAIADLTDAIKIDPAYTRAYFMRADMYAQSGKPVLGIPDLQKVIELNTDSQLTKSAEDRLEVLLQ